MKKLDEDAFLLIAMLILVIVNTISLYLISKYTD